MNEREPFHRVRSVRLVPLDDEGYLAAMAEQALAHRRYGPREETSATYRVSGRVETAVRGWLAARVPLLQERVLAAEVLYRGSRSYETLYLELDAVQGSGGAPTRVYEVKFTSNPAAIRRGFRQLARARSLLETRFERVDTVVVLVQSDRGSLDLDDPNLRDVVPIEPAALDDGMPPGLPLLRLDPTDLAEWLADEDPDLLRSARDEGDANVLARQERAARLEAGEELPEPHRPRRPNATITFGDDSPNDDADSPFAALRGLARGEAPAPLRQGGGTPARPDPPTVGSSDRQASAHPAGSEERPPDAHAG